MATFQVIALLFLIFGIGGGYAIGIWGVQRLRQAEENQERQNHS